MTSLTDFITQALSKANSAIPAENTTITAFLDQHVPGLEQSARELLAPPLTAGEVFSLIQKVSEAASAGLGVLAGQDRKAVVKGTVKYLFRTYAAGRLPAVVSLLLTDTVLDNVVEFIYQGIVKVGGGK